MLARKLELINSNSFVLPSFLLLPFFFFLFPLKLLPRCTRAVRSLFRRFGARRKKMRNHFFISSSCCCMQFSHLPLLLLLFRTSWLMFLFFPLNHHAVCATLSFAPLFLCLNRKKNPNSKFKHLFSYSKLFSFFLSILVGNFFPLVRSQGK